MDEISVVADIHLDLVGRIVEGPDSQDRADEEQVGALGPVLESGRGERTFQDREEVGGLGHVSGEPREPAESTVAAQLVGPGEQVGRTRGHLPVGGGELADAQLCGRRRIGPEDRRRRENPVDEGRHGGDGGASGHVLLPPGRVDLDACEPGQGGQKPAGGDAVPTPAHRSAGKGTQSMSAARGECQLENPVPLVELLGRAWPDRAFGKQRIRTVQHRQ